jgi:2-polyprenyl-3-methyl-5-hydroxy-6-metoxy-1,4-benzoquinol methylase
MDKMVQTLEWNDAQVKSFWDFYSQYPELYFTYQYGDKIVETIWPHMHENSMVLDYGCGTGFLMKYLLKKPVKVYGTDSSEDSLKSVILNFGNEENFKGAFNVDQISSDKKFEGFFDAVCLIEVVEHLTDEHMRIVLTNIKKLLKKGGRVIITTPNEEDLSASLVYCPVSQKIFHRWQHMRSWSGDTLSKYLQRYGFSALKVFTCDFSRAKPKGLQFRPMVRELLVRAGLSKKPEVKGPHLVFIGENI